MKSWVKLEKEVMELFTNAEQETQEKIILRLLTFEYQMSNPYNLLKHVLNSCISLNVLWSRTSGSNKEVCWEWGWSSHQKDSSKRNQNAEESQTPQPCQSYWSVQTEEETSPGVWVLWSHCSQWAGEVSQGCAHATHKGEHCFNRHMPSNHFLI